VYPKSATNPAAEDNDDVPTTVCSTSVNS
jgi:hypothetical protein